MEMNNYSLDLLLVPFSILINASYHFYLWHCCKSKHPETTVRANTVKKRVWFQGIMANDKKATLGVQTMRNSLMSTIFAASVSIAISAALASFANNSYASSRLFAGRPAFGSQTEAMLALKCSSVSLLMLLSFFCNSMAVGFIIEAFFLANLSEGGEAFMAHAEEVMVKGVVLGVAGNRVLYVGLSLLIWMLGPWAFGLCSVGMLVGFYKLDFSLG